MPTTWDADPLRLAAVEERRAALTGLTRKYGEDIAAVRPGRAECRAADRTRRRRRADRGTDRRAGRAAGRTGRTRTGVDGRADGGRRSVRGCRDRRAGLAGHAARARVLRHPADRGPGGRRGRRAARRLRARGCRRGRAAAGPAPGGARAGRSPRARPVVVVPCDAGGGGRVRGRDPVPTYLFDEVDAGVGGKAAVEIGRRLARLAKTAQVVVVTHLPQVAAFADRQLLVEKTNDGVGHPFRCEGAGRRGAGPGAVPDARRPGGLGDGPGARGGAAGDGSGGSVGEERSRLPRAAPIFTRVGDSARRIPRMPRPHCRAAGLRAFPEPAYVLASLAWSTRGDPAR
ncbi:hypothetical protein SVIOM74S_02514 [Streptomyces violarus]